MERSAKNVPERVLLLQPHGELRHYTAALLTEMGVRHVLAAQDLEQAQLLLYGCRSAGQNPDMVVCDDGITDGGALDVLRLVGGLPMLVVSDPPNPRNARLAARLGIKALLFRPYGQTKFSTAIKRVFTKK